MLSIQELLREAAAAGFQAEPLEKVVHIIELLESLRKNRVTGYIIPIFAST